eukprot:scaffold1894_cov368-Prasinococcus_capsulatus_cf.AAC.10
MSGPCLLDCSDGRQRAHRRLSPRLSRRARATPWRVRPSRRQAGPAVAPVHSRPQRSALHGAHHHHRHVAGGLQAFHNGGALKPQQLMAHALLVDRRVRHPAWWPADTASPGQRSGGRLRLRPDHGALEGHAHLFGDTRQRGEGALQGTIHGGR